MTPKYPLEAALTVRRSHADAEAERLAGVARSVRAAETAAAEADERLQASERADREFEQEQAERLQQGAERAADLMLVEACRRGRALQREALTRQLSSRQEDLERARASEVTARQAFERAFAEQRAVERHRDEWLAAQREKAEQRQEEQGLEIWGAKRFASEQR